MTAQPMHAEVFGIANELCASTITEVEEGLARQRASDAVEVIRRQEEERVKVEMARIAAEDEERDKQEHLKQLEQDRLHIEAAERELQIRKQALRDAQNGPHARDDDNNNGNDGSVSTPEGHLVRHVFIHSVYPNTNYNSKHIRELPRARQNVSWMRRRVRTFPRRRTKL